MILQCLHTLVKTLNKIFQLKYNSDISCRNAECVHKANFTHIVLSCTHKSKILTNKRRQWRTRAEYHRLKSGPPLIRGLDIHKNNPVSITKLPLGLRVGFISSSLTAYKFFSVNPRAITWPPKMSPLLEAKSMPALIIKPSPIRNLSSWEWLEIVDYGRSCLEMPSMIISMLGNVIVDYPRNFLYWKLNYKQRWSSSAFPSVPIMFVKMVGIPAIFVDSQLLADYHCHFHAYPMILSVYATDYC